MPCLLHPVLFGEALRITTDKLDCKNFYAFNPEFDTKQAKSNAMMKKGNK